MPYILDRDGLEYYHRRRKWLLFGDLYDVTFTGDYNVNQTTIAKLKVRKQSSEVQTDTNDMEFPDVYCEAEVTPDTGYTAGEATVTREGNLFIVDVDNADIRLVTLTIDPTPMESLSIPFTLPDGTVQYVQTSTSESVTVQLPVGSTVRNYSLRLYSGYSSYVNGTQTDIIRNYVVSGDQTLSIVYQLDEYGISVYFIANNNAPLVVSWTAEITHPETGVVTTTTGTSSTANIPAPVGAQYKVTGVPPTGYTTTQSPVSGTVPARNVQLTVTFTQIPQNELDISFTGEPNSGLACGDTSSLNININVTGTSEENRYDILRDGTVIGSYDVPLLVDDSFTGVFEYEVTQEDIDNGSVTFTLVDSSNDETVDSITLYAEEASPEISVAFHASPTSGIKLGDYFEQEVTVYNSGNVTLTDIVVSSNFGTINVPAGTSIPPGQSITLTNGVTAQPSMGTLNSSGDSYTIVGNVSVNASSVRGDAPQTSYGTYTIIADKITTAVSAQGKSIREGKDEVITANVPKGATGTCTATIGSSDYTATVVNGMATIIIPNLSK